MTTDCEAQNLTYALTEEGFKDGGCFIGDGYLQSGMRELCLIIAIKVQLCLCTTLSNNGFFV